MSEEHGAHPSIQLATKVLKSVQDGREMTEAEWLADWIIRVGLPEIARLRERETILTTLISVLHSCGLER